jgi:hypothetical protein
LLCSFQGADWIDSPADLLAFLEQAQVLDASLLFSAWGFLAFFLPLE